MMGCAIFYKKCQKLDTMTSQLLISVPNTIKEEIIKQTMDKELKHIKQILLLTNKEYKLTREQSNNWMRYAVLKDFPAGMPWEEIEEKKQKQGTSNSRLAYRLHMHRLYYKRMKYLLAYAKDKLAQDMGKCNLYHQNTRGKISHRGGEQVYPDGTNSRVHPTQHGSCHDQRHVRCGHHVQAMTPSRSRLKSETTNKNNSERNIQHDDDK